MENNLSLMQWIKAPFYVAMSNPEPFLLIGGLTLSYFAIKALVPNSYQENGMWYTKFANTSAANPINLVNGYRWSSIDKLKKFMRDGNRRDCYLGDFRVDENFAKKVKMPKWYKKYLEKLQIKINKQDLVESMLVIGKMKSGKTEFFNHLLKQDFYDRAIIHSIKISFEKYFYDRNSIILNPYLEKSHIWDIMSEEEGTIKTFFMNFLKGTIGDKVDFFSATAERFFNEMMITVKTHYSHATPAQKWLLFIKVYKDFFYEVEGLSDRDPKASVAQTMQSMIEPLEMIAWQLEDHRKKTFTIKEFFKMENQAKLFLSNQTKYQDKLTPLFAAFTAAFAKYHTSLPETKTNITLYKLDEYMSFVEIIDKAARRILHTLIRGHGGILCAGMQYLPADKDLLLDLTSSAFAWIFFSTIEDDTKMKLIEKTEYESWYKETNEKKILFKKRSDDNSKKQKKGTAITKEMLDGLGKNFEYICYIPTYNILFRAYTPQPELIQKHDDLKNTDFTEFYKIKYPDKYELSQEDLDNMSFADLYKDNTKLSKEERYKLWDRYEKLTTDNAKLKFKRKYNLKESEMKLLFEDLTQNKEVVANKMSIFNLEQRLAIFSEFTMIDADDYTAKFEFINKHELWGALPGFFEFTPDQLSSSWA
ncbi:MAG: type IV secretion system DNA-binding domain-containing protein [Arcobacteraceae bacterium]|nr:type IV secretion system DNA-binding domain-containing protein [Arcobacteraceae bacterium]